MNYIDILLLTFFLWAAYRGFSKGFVIQLASLAALVLGILGAIRFSHYVTGILIEKLDISGKYLPLISFALTFIGIVILIHILAQIIDKLMKVVALGIVNRLAGTLFSILKYGLILSIVLILLGSIHKKKPFLPQRQIDESLLYQPVIKFAPSIFPYLREQFNGFKKDYFKSDFKPIATYDPYAYELDPTQVAKVLAMRH